MNQEQAHAKVVDRLRFLIESGEAEQWEKPWRLVAGSFPANLVSRNTYRGSNLLILALVAHFKGYSNNWWIGFKQASKMGGKVRENEKGTAIWYPKTRWYTTEDEDGNETREKYIYGFGVAYVWNLDQIDGIEAPQVEDLDPLETIEAADALWDNWKDAPRVETGNGRAAYKPDLDLIVMPDPETFKCPESWHITLWHEGVHGTGHEDRLDRQEMHRYFSNRPVEEMIAEFGAQMIAGHLGLDATMHTSAGYIQHWWGHVQEQPELLFKAAAAAQKAADYIIGGGK